MTKSMFIGLYVGMLIAVVVSVDLLFFRNRFWERLMANIGIVLVFAAFYLRFERMRSTPGTAVTRRTRKSHDKHRNIRERIKSSPDCWT